MTHLFPPQIYIWKLPYDPPQTAIGLFTLDEAADFLKTDADQLGLVLDASGSLNINGYHLEYDE